MQKIRVAIIGTGFGARVHAPLMMKHLGFEVVAISSVARGRVEKVKQETGIDQVYGDWREMLYLEEVDLVSVVSAPYLHQEMVLESFKRGVHVLCEKPMAFDAKQAKEMIVARKQAGRYGFINFEWRFLPARLKVKEVLDSGVLGEILHINYSAVFPGYHSSTTRKLGWLGEAAKGGGMLGALGSHMFDSLLWWTGEEVVSLTGQLATHIPEYTDTYGEKEIRTADDSFQVIGTLDKGATFHVGLVYASRHTIGSRLEVIGKNGTLVMTDDKKVQVGIGNEPLQEVELLPDLIIPETIQEPATRYYNCFYRMLDQVYAAIALNQPSPYLPTFEDGYQVQRILDAVRQK